MNRALRQTRPAYPYSKGARRAALARRPRAVTRDASNDPYRGMFEHAHWGIFQTTRDGTYLRANPALAGIYGYASVGELLDALTDIGRQLYVDPERRDAFVREMQATGSVAGFESEIHRCDGSIIWISETCRAVHDEHGRFRFYEGLVEDITARKLAEADLHAARTMAEQASRAKTLFLANMSHELRTPLNAILGFSEMIRDELFGPIGNIQYREFAGDILDSGKHLLDVINDILDLTKFESGKLTLQEQVLDLGTVLSACARLVAEPAKRGALRLVILPPDQPIAFRADATRIKQILLNLLSNAIKFTPPGGTVTLSARRTADALQIEVADQGIGMSEAEIARAMLPFQQVDNSFTRRHQGTGLGLPLTKSLVELHGGTFAIESMPEEGTTARVLLPLLRLAAGEAA